jgi:hypothetical protein
VLKLVLVVVEGRSLLGNVCLELIMVFLLCVPPIAPLFCSH